MRGGTLALFLVAMVMMASTASAGPKSAIHASSATKQALGHDSPRSRRHAPDLDGPPLGVEPPFLLPPDVDPEMLRQLEEEEEIKALPPWQLQELLEQAALEQSLGPHKPGPLEWQDSKPDGKPPHPKFSHGPWYDDDDDDDDDDDLMVAKRPFGRLMGGYKLNFGRLFGKRMYHNRNSNYRRYRRRGFGRVLHGGYRGKK